MDSNVRKASTIFIEISGKCNAKCPYCTQRRLKQTKHFGGAMSPILFEQILDHLFELGIFEKAKTYSIPLYNWGEPFLNTEINDILQILKKKKLYADISSNLIVKPDIDKELLPIISKLTFSLSGFSQDSYGRIHGASLKKVLNNFEDFYVILRQYSPKTMIQISWHRYLFNENEFWDAYKYFNRPGIRFLPLIAFINDFFVMMDFLKERLSEDRKNQFEKDLFLNHIRKRIAYHKKKSKNYRCPAWDFLVIDEIGQLLLCCGPSRYDSNHVLGNILEMSAEEIWKSKLSNALCNECISSGLARWAYNQDIGGFYDRPWPSGGGLYHLKLWSQYNFFPFFNSYLARMLRKLPNGEKIIGKIKNFRRFIASVWRFHR